VGRRPIYGWVRPQLQSWFKKGRVPILDEECTGGWEHGQDRSTKTGSSGQSYPKEFVAPRGGGGASAGGDGEPSSRSSPALAPPCVTAGVMPPRHPVTPRASPDLAPSCVAASAVVPSHACGGRMAMRLGENESHRRRLLWCIVTVRIGHHKV
jgi:hypothetical protein